MSITKIGGADWVQAGFTNSEILGNCNVGINPLPRLSVLGLNGLSMLVHLLNLCKEQPRNAQMSFAWPFCSRSRL